MKKSKKLLLAGVAAMGLVGIAAGTVSTFAWFNVDQVKATLVADPQPAFTVGAGYSNESAAKIVASFTGHNTALVVTNTSGDSKYVLNGVAFDTTGNRYGTCTISLAWATGGDAPTETQMAAAIGSYTLTVTPSGYAKVGTALTGNKAAGNVYANWSGNVANRDGDEITFTVTVAKSGSDYVINFSDNSSASHEFYYAVQAKYEETADNFDQDSDHTGDKFVATLA